jgi:hypothetical protein
MEAIGAAAGAPPGPIRREAAVAPPLVAPGTRIVRQAATVPNPRGGASDRAFAVETATAAAAFGATADARACLAMSQAPAVPPMAARLPPAAPPAMAGRPPTGAPPNPTAAAAPNRRAIWAAQPPPCPQRERTAAQPRPPDRPRTLLLGKLPAASTPSVERAGGAWPARASALAAPMAHAERARSAVTAAASRAPSPEASASFPPSAGPARRASTGSATPPAARTPTARTERIAARADCAVPMCVRSPNAAPMPTAPRGACAWTPSAAPLA